jgi:hypothetical protein
MRQMKGADVSHSAKYEPSFIYGEYITMRATSPHVFCANDWNYSNTDVNHRVGLNKIIIAKPSSGTKTYIGHITVVPLQYCGSLITELITVARL